MDKKYHSLGLMSGTSLDGIDASIVESDGDSIINIRKNAYFSYPKKFKLDLKELIEKTSSREEIQKNLKKYNDIERKLTLFHAEISESIIQKYDYNIDLIGFHGQTIIHKPRDKYSIQMGDGRLLSQILKKKVIYQFRKNDIQNLGQGAPLASIYHYALAKKLKIKDPVIFLNIGGISNITYVDNDNFESRDVGPGNVLMDKYIKKIKNNDYDYKGGYASIGKIDYSIVNQALDNDFFSKKNKASFDINDFDYYFIKGLEFEDAMATLNFYSAKIISDLILEKYLNVKKIILCGGGRKNKILINNIKNLIKIDVQNIDTFDLDGDFIESQAFAYLAIRSFLKKNISYPQTTKVKKPVTGGELIINY
ncbi:anhydro-N-acetylmuramic acid kinase [Candidatus Pelagibacter sp.]|nr:anhydro-N-acetylmuramic acid kinase [Candidatus Pelagibacter sp.]